MRFRHRRERGPRLTREGEALVAKVEAFLSGSYLAEARRRHEVIPNWAWINTIAHGDLETIREAAPTTEIGSPARNGEIAESWRSAEGLLAVEVLEFVNQDPTRLSNVQQHVIIPLELRLIENEATNSLTALELVRSTRAALRSNSL